MPDFAFLSDLRWRIPPAIFAAWASLHGLALFCYAKRSLGELRMIKLRNFIIRLLAGRSAIALNISVEAGTVIASGRNALIANVVMRPT